DFKHIDQSKGVFVPAFDADRTSVEQCMIHSGFAVPKREQNCTYNLQNPICQPNAVIPTRSVERRLNSYFCKKSPKDNLCQVVVIEPPSEPAKPVLPQPKSQYELERERNRTEQQRQQQQNDWLKRKGGF
ncbi:MAG: hypothetical protein K2P98_04595, partial [Neisseriaceae bacterium]|nr:hypothetical protein [Neisseriaceae bacterium]